MAVNDESLIEADTDNAETIKDTYSFPKEEQEWHAHYDPGSDRTYVSASWSTAITKLQKNPSFVVTNQRKQESGNVSHISGYLEGCKLTVRK